MRHAAFQIPSVIQPRLSLMTLIAAGLTSCTAQGGAACPPPSSGLAVTIPGSDHTTQVIPVEVPACPGLTVGHVTYDTAP